MCGGGGRRRYGRFVCVRGRLIGVSCSWGRFIMGHRRGRTSVVTTILLAFALLFNIN